MYTYSWVWSRETSVQGSKTGTNRESLEKGGSEEHAHAQPVNDSLIPNTQSRNSTKLSLDFLPILPKSSLTDYMPFRFSYFTGISADQTPDAISRFFVSVFEP